MNLLYFKLYIKNKILKLKYVKDGNAEVVNGCKSSILLKATIDKIFT